MDLVEPEIDYLGLARSLGVAAESADSVADAVDLMKKGLAGNTPLLIDVALDRRVQAGVSEVRRCERQSSHSTSSRH